MIAGPNVFIYQDRVVICTEAFKDESDDPTIRRSEDPTIHGSDRGNRPTSLRAILRRGTPP